RTLQSTTARKLGRAEGPWRGLQTDILRLNLFAHLGRESKLGYYIPVQAGLPLRMPQLMVSYTILFWLGSLVRYDPHSVDALKDSEYWTLIDGFMSQSRLWLLELFEWAFYQAETTLWTTR
ncbi:MAG TPA: YaaC family protein, partial [Terriglobales bacterium]|nr:YaaC family protein [Terriglobales bacterium]